MKPNSTGVTYIRVSSEEQSEGFSLEAQQKLLDEYARAKAITVVYRFSDMETAKKAGRRQFSEMVKFLKKHPDVRIILVEKTDRLLRNLSDYGI